MEIRGDLFEAKISVFQNDPSKATAEKTLENMTLTSNNCDTRCHFSQDGILNFRKENFDF